MMLPLQYQGEGHFTTPPGFAKRCDKELVIGEALQWEQVNERSMASHRHYFALVREAWNTLPEHLVDEYPNPTVLRKRMLINAGFCSVSKIIAADATEAAKTCALIQAANAFAVCMVSENVVTAWLATSQRMKIMGPKIFQESKEAVLHEISKLIGSDATELGKAA